MVSQSWKTMSREERSQWEDLARQDKERYEAEKRIYTGPWKVPAVDMRGSRKPNKKNPPAIAFQRFCNEWRAQVQTANPTATAEEVSVILSKMWRGVSPIEKKRYEESAGFVAAAPLKPSAEKEHSNLLPNSSSHLSKTTSASIETESHDMDHESREEAKSQWLLD